jgi:hypothetical protein
MVAETKISELKLILTAWLQYIEDVLWLYILINDTVVCKTVKCLKYLWEDRVRHRYIKATTTLDQ